MIKFAAMTFIDTHTHLYLPDFDNDRAAVVQRAIEKGISQCILPNIDSKSLPQMKKMHAEYPQFCRMAMALHPTSVKEDFEEELALVYHEIKNGAYIAIGEMGIDLYWDKTYYEQQQEAFRRQVAWALEFHLPLIIHSRDSFDEIFALMDELWTPQLKGVFHCFTGTHAQAHKITSDYGFKLGIGGVLTFKNSGLSEEIKDIGLQHLILETDAPFLSPTPFRGKRNESSYTELIAQKLAKTKNTSLEEVAQITSQNASQLFHLLKE